MIVSTSLGSMSPEGGRKQGEKETRKGKRAWSRTHVYITYCIYRVFGNWEKGEIYIDMEDSELHGEKDGGTKICMWWCISVLAVNERPEVAHREEIGRVSVGGIFGGSD
jgi:hypothetical protein